jgi:hypothetical protein
MRSSTISDESLISDSSPPQIKRRKKIRKLVTAAMPFPGEDYSN